MKKIFLKSLILFFFSSYVFAESMPEEFKIKKLGIGSKKLDMNYLCKNVEDVKEKEKIGFKKYSHLGDDILFFVGYDDDLKLYAFPLVPVIQYKNLKNPNDDFKKNEVFIYYNVYPEKMKLFDKDDHLFHMHVFVNPKTPDYPFYYFNDMYTLTKKEFKTVKKFADLPFIMGLSDDEYEEIYSDKKYDNFVKKLINENNQLHNIASKALGLSDPPTMLELFSPPNRASRETDINKMINRLDAVRGDRIANGISYQCGKK